MVQISPIQPLLRALGAIFGGLQASQPKPLLLFAVLVLSSGDFMARISGFGSEAGLAVYLGLYGLLLLALIATAFIRQTWLRLGFGLLFAVGTLCYEGFRFSSGMPPSYDSFATLSQTTESAGDALAQNGRPLLLAALEALLLLLAIGWKLPRRPLPFGRWLFAAPLAALAALTGVLYMRGGDGANGLPPAYPVLGFAGLKLIDEATSPHWQRQPVRLVPVGPPLARNIVLLIDESIAGNYLDINNRYGVRSGLAGQRPGLAILNYGIAASVTSCSANTNVTLRHGGTRADYQRINASLPSIFAFARRAGMKTVYIDGQGRKGHLTNLINRAERREIDRLVQLDPAPVVGRDQQAAELVARITRERGSHFILVNKVGAHFPVHDKFPDSHFAFRPALPRGKLGNISDTGSSIGFDGSPESWRRYRNAYRNTLLWNVGSFFDHLLAGAGMKDTAIIYTSDHGQRLHEDGLKASRSTTHCVPLARPEDGAVPLVLLLPEALSKDWEASAGRNRNRMSHFRIFPSMLALMGYDRAAIAPTYGADLMSPASDPMTFNTFFHAQFGRKPEWLAIDPAHLPEPPPGDFAKR